MRTGYLGLGANVGDRRAALQGAVDALARRGVAVTASSSTYDTDPVGEVLDQPDFLNACVRIATDLEPEALLGVCKAVEEELGRTLAGRPGYLRHGPRPIDVDLLLLGDETTASDRLRLPHPQVLARRFVLIPLLELELDLAVPDGRRLADALALLPLDEGVRRSGPPLEVPGGGAPADPEGSASLRSAAATYPPAPWRIAGPAAIVPVLVPLAAARAHVPADVAVVPVAPGRTAGGLLVARYEDGSTLRYGELLVFPALTRVAGSVGMWISHAYVDSEASLRGGRRMWGVPKDLATFAWRDGGVTITRDDGTPLLDLTAPTPRATLALPAFTRSNGTTGGSDRRVFSGGGRLRLAPARARVDVPAASPFAGLGLAGRRVALAGHADFRLRPPRLLAA